MKPKYWGSTALQRILVSRSFATLMNVPAALRHKIKSEGYWLSPRSVATATAIACVIDWNRRSTHVSMIRFTAKVALYHQVTPNSL